MAVKLKIKDGKTVHCPEVLALAAHYLGGDETKYRAEVHIPLMLTIFHDGGDVHDFCIQSMIVRSTFFDWLELHSAFAKVYSVSKDLAHRYWSSKMPENLRGTDNFDYKHWQWFMKNRFGYTDSRKVLLPKLRDAKTFNDQVRAIVHYVGGAELTPYESQQLSNLISVGVKVDDATDKAKRLEAIEKALNVVGKT